MYRSCLTFPSVPEGRSSVLEILFPHHPSPPKDLFHHNYFDKVSSRSDIRRSCHYPLTPVDGPNPDDELLFSLSVSY